MEKLYKRKTLLSMFILVALVISSFGITIPKVLAAGTILVNPSAIDDTGIAPGATVKFNASGADLADVFTWQVQIEYNPAVLNCSKVTIPVGSIFKLDVDVAPIINNALGKAVIGSSKIVGQGVSGSGVFAIFEFKVIARGYSKVNYSRPLGVDTFILDSLQHDIPVAIQDGYFNNYVPPPPPPTAKLYINPAKTIDPTLTAGQSFNVSYSIINGTNVNSWTANILYSNAVLNATGVTEGDYLKSAGTTTFTSTIENSFNLTHGRIHLACALTSGAVNGSGELAKLTFEVLALGETNITVADADLRDPANAALPFTTANGYFNNMLIGKLAIDPPEVSGPGYLPGTTFTINVTLDDVENLKVCIFNLTYIPLIIQEININVPSVLGQTPVKKLQVDDDAGYIWANLTYRNGVSTFDPVTIMTVEFQVIAMGISPINLTDTHMYDTTDQPIVHEVHHGIFIGLIRDVAVLAVTPDLNIVYQNWTVSINVTVKNKGNVTETFDVKIYYDGNLGATATVVDLAPDTETTIRVIWNTTGVPYCHNYTISATAGPVPYEFNLGDNTLTDGNVKVRIMGDVNGDGTVDMRDINEVCNAYGAYPGHPRWNLYADFDRNGRVDMRDIGTVCAFFGQHC